VTGGSDEIFFGRGNKPPVLKAYATSNDTWVLQLTPSFYTEIVKKHPSTFIFCVKKMLSLAPTILRVVDFGTKMTRLQTGEDLVIEGEPSRGCLYVLLFGRARSCVHDDGAMVVLADHARGALIGETEVLTGGTYKASVQAVRFSSFAAIPSSVLNLIVKRHPRVLATLAEHLSEKASSMSRVRSKGMYLLDGGAPLNQLRHRMGDTRTVSIMILPVSGSVPLDLFVSRLEAAISNAKHTVKTISSSLASSMMGLEDELRADDMNVVLESWLTMQEEQHLVRRKSLACFWVRDTWLVSVAISN